ncbi:5-formyltetrahydrofolate cyclo-ligase [Nocardia asiatica]|uniref:5-formyltetrahydrofolate cyclo-ligase n=1 Tax=Nocardia asiatica TaxID=209252 RepID=UPI0024540C97|nr:5-formyltetrahydrofolate cyclo-ligase [Nocardia asiatica]
MSVEQRKQNLREEVWAMLEHEGVTRQGAPRHIPAFVGAELAAERLASLNEWKRAEVLKTVPDTAQLPVRIRALAEGKLVYMAVPRLAAPKPFYFLDPAGLVEPPERAAQRDVAAAIGRNVDVNEMHPVDMVVLGSVAVDCSGARLGKGAGYSDIELALLQEGHRIGPETVIATTVHRLQVLDVPLPESSHDFRVDVIVTPEDVIRCDERRRPVGLIWDSLPQEKIAAIPALAARQAAANPDG